MEWNQRDDDGKQDAAVAAARAIVVVQHVESEETTEGVATRRMHVL